MDYDKGLHEGYAEARRLQDETAALWLDVARRFIPAVPDLRIIDVGSGTGRFAPLLAEGLNAAVVGVEPSVWMRGQAEANAAHPRVRYLAGTAGALPVADAEFRAAWLSFVIHHVPDHDACAAELKRVLRPGGVAVIRNTFSGRLDGIPMYEFFPSALDVDTDRLPTADRVKAAFARAGFRLVADEDIVQMLAPTFDEFLARTRLRNASTFALISARDFKAGIARMEEVAAERPGPVREPISLLVFARPA